MRIMLFLFVWLFIQSVSAQQVTGFNLIDAGNNTLIRMLTSGDTIFLSSTSNFSMEVVANNAGSVVLELSGDATHSQTESVAPYALFGDNSGNYNAWNNPQPGNYTLTATPYSQSGGAGTAGPAFQIAFVISNNSGPTGMQPTFKVLHYTETSGFDHNTRSSSLVMFEQLGTQYNFEVVDDDDGSSFDSLAYLEQFAVVVFSNTSGDAILTAAQRTNFEAYINNGGSFLGIHAASDTYRHSTANGINTGTWDWYAELLGGSIQQGPNHVSGTPSYAMNKIGTHPSTDSLPDPWQKNEEYYYWESGYYNTGNMQVLEVEETVGPNNQVNSYDAPRPMSWYKELPSGGRSFYTALGHANSNFTSDADFRKHIRDALLWCASRPVTISGTLQKWHKVTLTFEGINTCEDANPNPFTDYRLVVSFTNGSNTYEVPGFYAADGNASETSASCGNKWCVHFTPDATGTWSYAVSFRTGNNIAIDNNSLVGTAVVPLNGTSGEFTIASSNKTGKDFRAKGMLRYVGEHYLQFAETGEYYLKGGADSPENLLGYADFDQTTDLGGTSTPGLNNGLHEFDPHVQDWKPGDPKWQGGKGKGLIGALNYLASQGGNSVYFLTYNIDGGDGRDTWVWTSPNERYRFDISKLDQWEIIFSHMDSLGIQMHVITQETENDQNLGGNGQLNDIRKLYYRELIARFSHHLAIQWNLGEENTNSDAEKASFAQYIRETDPYDHPINVHTQYGNAISFYDGLINNINYRKYFEATSIQGNATSYNDWAIDLRNSSANAGRKWVIYGDEQGPAVNASINNLEPLRKEALWGNLMGGGSGVEWYFGYQGTFGDVQSEDWRVAEPLWEQTRFAIDFFQTYLPFWEMTPNNDLLTSGSNDYCIMKEGEVYTVYLKFGGGGGFIGLDINTPGTYTVKWYNPREGGILQDGSITTIQVSNAGTFDLGVPPVSGNDDWVVLVRNDAFTGSSSPSDIHQFQLYPNPIEDAVLVSFQLKQPQTVSFTVCDVEGRVMLKEYQGEVLNFRQTLDLKNLASGLYLISILVGDEKVVRRILKR